MDEQQLLSVKRQFEEYRKLFEEYLTATQELRAEGIPPRLSEAMEYSLMGGGKRLRPVLCLAAAERCGLEAKKALPMALAVEMLHTATLIHDDLPCMDDDDMRRGRPSNHAKFGETLAVLAGDALMAQPYEFALNELKEISADKVLAAMKIFAHATGAAGVIGGQVLDMIEEAPDDPDYVRRIAKLKTGALLEAAVTTGAALATSDKKLLSACREYALHLGSAFQIVDDILDVTSTAEELGKTPGKDSEQGKLTHVTVYGMEKAREMASQESEAARRALSELLKEDDFLLLLPDYLVDRSH